MPTFASKAEPHVPFTLRESPSLPQLQLQGSIRVGRWHTVTVGLEQHSRPVVRPHRDIMTGLVLMKCQPPEFGDFIEEHLVGRAPGVGMHAHVGDGV